MFSIEIFQSFMLMFVLLNPFLMSIYLISFIRHLSMAEFMGVVRRAFFISTIIFVVFAITGDWLFSDLLQVRFGSFLIFGGAVFLLIGINQIFNGGDAMESLRGPAQHVTGSISLPFMIGPGTVSASILIGSDHNFAWSTSIIVAATVLAALSLFGIKWLHDFVKNRNERLISRYVETVGQISALIIGTIAVDMLIRGIFMVFFPEG